MTTFPRTAPRRAPRTLRPLLALRAALPLVLALTSVHAQTTASAVLNGRLLASNCFQCHGTGGVGGFDRIRGSDAAEVRDYLRKSARSDIMAAHAQGYTSAQLDAIIAYLKQ